MEAEQFREDEDSGVSIDKITEQLDSIVSTLKPKEIPFTITLYKTNKLNGKSEQIDKWREEMPPDSHEIGIMYGAGQYEFLIQWVENGAKVKRGRKHVVFTLGDNYEELHRKHLEKNAPEKLEPATPAGSNDQIVKLLMMQMNQQQDRSDKFMQSLIALAGIVVPAIMNRPTAPAHVPAENPMNQLMLNLIPKMLEGKNQETNNLFEAQTQIFQKGLEMGKSAVSPEKEKTDWMDVINTAVENADKILGFPTALVQSKIRKDDRLQAIAKNPEQKAVFLSKLEERHGEEKAQKIITKAGFDFAQGKTAVSDDGEIVI